MKRLIILFAAACFTSRAEVRETMTMGALEPEITDETLLVFDIDNTLIEPVGNLGSDQWYFFLIRRFETLDHLRERDAEDKAVKLWDMLQENLAVKPVEELTPSLIRRQQDRGIRTLGLTAREPEVATATLRALAAAGIDLGRNTIASNSLAFEMTARASFTNGVLLIGEHNSKGPALTNILARLGIRPAKIVYADDKKKHVDSLERECSMAGIPYVGFRYGVTDAKVKAFNEDTKDVALFINGTSAK